MSQPSILLVDDDRHLLDSMTHWLRSQGYQIRPAAGLQEAIGHLVDNSYDLVVADIRLQDGDGFDLLEYCCQEKPGMPVILFTGYGTVETGIEALRAGAFDLLTKPILDQELEMSISRALSQKRVIQENENLRSQLDTQFGLENVIGNDERMRRVFEIIENVADARATVLITGESGTGKSLIARALHRRSSRSNGPFVEVACGALPDTLLESELFGHVGGAFTGATGNKVGKFTLADNGTLFLDEISTASPSMQVKMLRVLQDWQFEQVGGTETYTVNVRLILATNEDLQQAVRDGRFREDLFYRVNVINIEIPPLRDRRDDIPLLAHHFLRNLGHDVGRNVEGFTPSAIAALQNYRWPGNVRELQNVVERAVLLGRGNLIDVSDLSDNLRTVPTCAPTTDQARTLKEALAGPERQIIFEVLQANSWNRNATAAALGINRTTLYKKMKRLGLEDIVPNRPAGSLSLQPFDS